MKVQKQTLKVVSGKFEYDACIMQVSVMINELKEFNFTYLNKHMLQPEEKLGTLSHDGE